MKKHLNPPTEVAVFNELNGIWQAAKGSIFAGMVIGIITEYAITQHIVSSHLNQLFKVVPAFVPMVLAGLFVVFLAIERNRYARQVSKMAINEDARQLGFAANIVVILVFVAVYAASIGLSIIGSTAIVSGAIQAPAIASTAAIDTSQSHQIEAINAQFTKDSASLKTTYQAQIQATKKRYNAEIIPMESKVKRNKATWLQPKIDKLYQERNQATADIEQQQASALLDLSRRTVEAKQATSNQAATSRQLITERNTKADATFTSIAGKAEKYVPLIVIAALIMVILGCFIDEKFKQQAGIKEVILPNEYDLLPSIGSEFKEAFKSVLQGIARYIALSIKGMAADASTVTDASTAELIRINLSKYKEKVINTDGEPTEQAPLATNTNTNAIQAVQQRRTIGYIQPATRRKKYVDTVDTANTADIQQQVVEMFNTYKIARRDLKAYQAKAKSGKGTPSTIQAGIEKATAKMVEAQQQLANLGYTISESRFKLSLEKK